MQVEWLHMVLQAQWVQVRSRAKHPDRVKIPDSLRLPRPGDPIESTAKTTRMTRASIRTALLGG